MRIANPILRSTIRTVLERSGYTVFGEAGNSAEAIAGLDKGSPDLVLLDILLPGESGLEILKKMREKQPEIRVLIVTAVNQDTINQEAKDLGAVGILYKPFDPLELKTAISKVIK